MRIKQILLISLLFATATAVIAMWPATVAAGQECAGVETSIIGGDMCDDGDPIFSLLRWVVGFLAAGIGIAAVGGLVYGAILYTTAADKPEQTKKAISIITNTVIGILLFGMMFALLNFLVPGGVFGDPSDRPAPPRVEPPVDPTDPDCNPQIQDCAQ